MINKMKNLNILLKEKDITQLNLSMKIGITQETISAYINGKAKPSADTLIKLADYFNTTTDYILDRTTINCRIEYVKPNNLNDDEFNIINKYRSLSKEHKAKIEAYIDGLSDK